MQPDLVYIDTSAFYALIDRADPYHKQAKALWPSLLDARVNRITSSYEVVETMELVQKRLGCEAAVVWQRAVLAVVDVKWVDQSLHDLGYELWLSLGRLGFSFTDCVGQILMSRYQISTAFCFKPKFADRGIAVVPSCSHRQGSARR